MFRSHSSPLWHGCMLSGMHYKFLIGKCLLSFHYISCLNGKLYFFFFIFWYYWQDRERKNVGPLASQSIFPLLLRKGDLSAIPLFWAANISDVVQVMLLLPVLSLRQVERVALTEPVNQSYSLANKDWSLSGLMVAGLWDPGLRFEWDDIRQIHGT